MNSQVAERERDQCDLMDYRAPRVDFSLPSYPLKDDECFIDKRAFGVPFIIDDQRALDDAMRYHKCAVKVHHVERLMLPFWFATIQSGGEFQAEVFIDDPTTIRQSHPVWCSPRPFQFAYPFGDHFEFNQLSASYSEVANTHAEECLAGTHVPSHLISRYELLEELERQDVTPKLVPFEMSVETVKKEVSQRCTRSRIETIAKKELKKFFGQIKSYNITFITLVHEILNIRPVFLPIYKMMVETVSNRHEPIPLFVSGVNGRCAGPIAHTTPRKLFALGGLTGAATAVVTGMMVQPPVAVALGATFGSAAMQYNRWVKYSKAVQHLDEQREEAITRATVNHETDKTGYKWRIEDEERYEYEHREELRSKARRRKLFEQRLREEAEREEAQKTGKNFGAAGRSQRSSKAAPGKHEVDPLGYYAILGLKGQETSASSKDVSKGFRRQAQKHHPDVTVLERQDQAKQMMQKIVEAYNILRDDKLRKEYDAGLLTKND